MNPQDKEAKFQELKISQEPQLDQGDLKKIADSEQALPVPVTESKANTAQRMTEPRPKQKPSSRRNLLAFGFLALVAMSAICLAYSMLLPGLRKNMPQFHEGLAKVKKDGKFGYVDLLGRFAIEPQFDEARDFSEGFAAVRENGLWGYVDKSGKMLPPRFSYASDFSHGTATVKGKEKWSFVQANGQEIKVNDIHDVGDSCEGLSVAAKNGRFGFVNATGKFVIPPVYLAATPFSLDRAGVCDSDEPESWHFIDGKGNRIGSSSYTKVENYSPAKLLPLLRTER